VRSAHGGRPHWFPEFAGKPWLPVLDQAMRNFKDESFIGQYLSPKLMREMRLFAITDDEKQSELEVSAIHDDAGYRRVREALSRQYDLGSREPISRSGTSTSGATAA
jgi:stage V sporulation protein R